MLLRIMPMNEPQGEGNCWGYCHPDEATCFVLEQAADDGEWDPLAGYKTWSDAWTGMRDIEENGE